MKKLLLLLLFTTLNYGTIAQVIVPQDSIKNDTTSANKITTDLSQEYKKYIPQFSPQSPNVAEFQKHSVYPVNLATGLAAIEIPIFTIKVGDLSLPIALKYHHGGHKISELSSWVGWGWSLNYGSGISCQVQGVADNNLGGMHSNAISSNLNLCTSSTDYYKGLSIKNKQIDSEPDIYSYSINDKSGKFTIGTSTETPFLMPFQPIKINKINNTSSAFSGFELIDTNGAAFTFGVADDGGFSGETQDIIEGSNTNFYKSSYNLTKIQSATSNEQIKLAYQNGAGQPH